jgi:hypothetical protein
MGGKKDAVGRKESGEGKKGTTQKENMYPFLRASTKFRKATISFVMSVWPSV